MSELPTGTVTFLYTDIEGSHLTDGAVVARLLSPWPQRAAQSA